MTAETKFALFVGGLMIASCCLGAPMIVVEARGGGLRPGMRVESASKIDLKDGERVTLIGADGRAAVIAPAAAVCGEFVDQMPAFTCILRWPQKADVDCEENDGC